MKQRGHKKVRSLKWANRLDLFVEWHQNKYMFRPGYVISTWKSSSCSSDVSRSSPSRIQRKVLSSKTFSKCRICETGMKSRSEKAVILKYAVGFSFGGKKRLLLKPVGLFPKKNPQNRTTNFMFKKLRNRTKDVLLWDFRDTKELFFSLSWARRNPQMNLYSVTFYFIFGVNVNGLLLN